MYNKETKGALIMQIEQIRSFVLLSTEKSISSASQKLHITQQGLSRQIKALEREMGTALFVRTNKGVELTNEGRVLLPEFQKMLAHYDKGLCELADYRKNHQETLHIAVCPGIKQAFGLEMFQTFQQKNPGIRLKLKFLSDIDCEAALYEGRANAAFLDWPIHAKEYDTSLIVKSPLVAVMRQGHPLSTCQSISMRQLAGMQIYIPDDSHRMSQRFAAHWPEFYQSVVLDFTTNDCEYFYQELPKQGDGVALTFRFLCGSLDPSLAVIPIEEESYVELYYCVRKDRSKSIALDCFSDFVRQQMRIREA